MSSAALNERLPESTAPGWQAPIDMLDACHGMLQQHLRLIWWLADYVPRHGADASAQRIAETVLRYFTIAAIVHHDDEERDLFPALLAAVPRQQRRVTKALIDRLLAEHQRMAALREPVLAKLLSITQGRAAVLAVDEVEPLASLYVEHIRVETGEILPLARRVLPAEMIRSLAVTMSVRRGLKLEDLPAAAGSA